MFAWSDSDPQPDQWSDLIQGLDQITRNFQSKMDRYLDHFHNDQKDL